MASAAQRWTQMIALEDLWSHATSQICCCNFCKSAILKKSSSKSINCDTQRLQGVIFAFLCSPGRAETLVRWAGNINHFSIACCLSNISARNYWNRLTHIEVIVHNISVVFEAPCILRQQCGVGDVTYRTKWRLSNIIDGHVWYDRHFGGLTWCG